MANIVVISVKVQARKRHLFLPTIVDGAQCELMLERAQPR